MKHKSDPEDAREREQRLAAESDAFAARLRRSDTHVQEDERWAHHRPGKDPLAEKGKK